MNPEDFDDPEQQIGDLRSRRMEEERQRRQIEEELRMRRIEEENDKKSIEKWGRFDTEEEKGGKQILRMISTGGFESHFAIGGSYLSIGSKTKSCLT